MRFTSFHRKPISIFVMFAFTVLLCFWANPSPAAPASPASEKSTTAAAANGEENGPGFIEEEASAPVAKKGKKIPWLVIGAVVVVGVAALYFLVLKKTKYELTVTLGEGCTGTPAVNAKYKKGESVAYSYSALNGYSNLQVKLDGVAVAAAGTITMDKAHSLDISATYGAAIQVNSTPSGAKIFVSNVDSGFTTPHTFQYPAAVTKTVMVRQCGYKDFSKTVTASLGETETVDAILVQGIGEEFSAPASSCWAPRAAGNWTVTGGMYKMRSSLSERDFSTYQFALPTNFTLEVRFKAFLGTIHSAIAVTLSDSADVTNFSGYAFQILLGVNEYSVWKYLNKNYVTGNSGASNAIRDWTASTHVHGNSWNIMKITRAGSNYALYFDNVLVTSFTDAAYNARYVCLNAYVATHLTEIQYDYVRLTIGGATALNMVESAQAAPAALGNENGL